MKKFVILLLLAISALLPSHAQRARMYTPAEGLPNSRINSIMQDRTGFVWISSGNGLTRFDGREFRHFHSDREGAWQLAGDLVLKTFQDSRGRIWVATATGLQTYNPSDGTFSTLILDDRAPFASTSYHITDLIEVNTQSGNQEIWAATYKNGLFIIDAGSGTILTDRSTAVNARLDQRSVDRLFADSNGQVWIAYGEGGLSVLSAEDLDIQSGIRIDMPEAVNIREVTVSQFIEDRASGNVIICSPNFGILVYDSATRSISRSRDSRARNCRAMSIIADNLLMPSGSSYLVGTENHGLWSYNILTDRMAALPDGAIPYDASNWKIHSLMTDSQGNIWIGVYERGILVIPNPMYGFEYTGVTSPFIDKDFPEGCVTAILRDPADRSMWIGTDGYGLMNIRQDGSRKFYDTGNSRMTDNTVMSLAADRHGKIWIATFSGGLYVISAGTGPRLFSDSKKLGTMKTVDLAYDAIDDVMYVGTHSDGLAVIDPATEKITSSICDDACKWISCLYTDRDGMLWVGTYNGPMVYNDRMNRIIRYNLADKSMNARIHCFLQADDGTMWMGTGDGLYAFDRTNGEERRYSEKDGLSSNVIYELLQSSDGDIWIATAFGLSKLDTKSGSAMRYYASDGLQENEFHQRAAMADSDGKLHFGGINGITSFYPHSVERKPHSVPAVMFTGISGTDCIPADMSSLQDNGVTLPCSGNSISVKFTSLEFSNPDKLRYAYMMDRVDRQWKTADASSSATYTNLAPGKYTLRVKAYFENSPDDFSSSELRVTVNPPWYFSSWAIAGYCLALALGTVVFLFGLQRHLRNRKRIMQAERDQDRLQAISDISRVICTPLNLVVTPLKELADSEKDTHRKGIMDLMYRNCLRVQSLVEQMAGTASTESTAEDRKTDSPAQGVTQDPDAVQRTSKARKNIVVVDDDPETRKFMAMELGSQYNVRALEGGRDAWDLISSSVPDAVLTEVISDGMSGYELCSRIRHNLLTSHIPVIILTSVHDQESVRKGNECGADLYLTKPVPMDILKSSIANLISTRETLRRKFAMDAGINYGKNAGDAGPNNGEEDFKDKAVRIITERMKDPGFGVEALSRELGISRVHLNRKLREVTGTSPGALIRTIRLRQAAFLMVKTGMNISEAASKTGFATASYFSSCFHDNFGMSPKEFMRKCRDKEELASLKNIFGESFINEIATYEK